MTVHQTNDQAAQASASVGRECGKFCPRCQRGGLRFTRLRVFLRWRSWLRSLNDPKRCDCTATPLAGRSAIALRLHAFECARFLASEPTIKQQLADAEILAVAMEGWASEPRFREHVRAVFVTACAEANSAPQAVDLASRVFSFLVADEVDPPASEGA